MNFFQILVSCFPWAICRDVFWIFENKIFSSASVCQQSSWNRNSSGARPSVHPSVPSTISEHVTWISFKFWCWFPELYPWTLCEGLKKKDFLEFFTNIFSFSSTWDLMGAKISKRYSSCKSQLNVFNLSWIFFPMVLKIRLRFLKFWKLKF